MSSVERVFELLSSFKWRFIKLYAAFWISPRDQTVSYRRIRRFSHRGKCRGQLVALYPGTVYRAWDPKFLQSINNDVFLQCIDKVYIDAKCTGLSNFVYKSCEARERIDARHSADLSWIEAARLGDDELLANMLNCGQLINNRTTEMNSNVAYAEIDVPLTELDRSLMKYIPNVVYSAHDEAHFRLCGLIALRDLDAPCELLSDYHTLVVVN